MNHLKNAAAVDVSEIIKHIGTTWYVSANGSNDYAGDAPDRAFLTIATAITAASAGDKIEVGAGTYTELGIDVSKQLTINFQSGVILDPASGTVLTVSANMCTIKGHAKLTPDGAIGVAVTGIFNWFEDLRVLAATTAWNITGEGNVFVDCRAGQPTVTAFHITAGKNRFLGCDTSGNGAATRGYWVGNGADYVRMVECNSTGHATAGFQIDTTSQQCIIAQSSSGGGDGNRIDNGENNMWSEFSDRLRREHHEHIVPFPDGEGGAGDPIDLVTDDQDKTNGAATTKDYWGAPKVLLAPAIITCRWDLIGVNLYAGTVDKIIRGCCYRIVNAIRASRDAGNAWDEGATVLTFNDASDLLVDDLLWVTSSAHKPHGEIVKITDVTDAVVTIARETSQFGAANTGLRWDHSTNVGAGTLYAYLCYRDIDQYHENCFDFSASGVKDFARFLFSERRGMNGNDGLIVRAQNGTDGTNGTNCDITAIYSD